MLLCCRCSRLLSPQFEKVSSAMAQNIRMRLPELAPFVSKALQNPESLSNDESKSWLRQPSRHSRTLKIRIPRTNRTRTRTNRTRTNRKVDNPTLFCQPFDRQDTASGYRHDPARLCFFRIPRSPTFWQMTFMSSVSLTSQPTEATSTGRASGNADRYRHWPHGCRLSNHRMITSGQSPMSSPFE